MNRRSFLGAGAALGAAGLAGCTSMFETTSATSPPPVVEDRPDAVYLPTHVEGMEMAGMAESGRYAVGVMYSYPHRFWTITAQDTNKVTIDDGDDAHLMASVWDTETGTVVPAANVSSEIRKDGEVVDSPGRTLWPMLSQNMGYHFGDNVTLDGDGTYTAALDIGAMQARGTGALEGAFGERTTIEVEFDYSEATKNDLSFEELPDEQGQLGAVEAMEMDRMPISRVPGREEFPGRVLGETKSGDATLLAAVADETPDFADAERYLVVSPRTPYRRYPLPLMGLSVTLDRGDETVFEGTLDSALDPDLGLHYGAGVEGVESGDELTISPDSPPQVARHEGYETAFVRMDATSLTV